jgi:hypothetical protein
LRAGINASVRQRTQCVSLVVGWPVALHRRVSKKLRVMAIPELEWLAPEVPLTLLVTGNLVGEGFDYPLLDRLVLDISVS